MHNEIDINKEGYDKEINVLNNKAKALIHQISFLFSYHPYGTIILPPTNQLTFNESN